MVGWWLNNYCSLPCNDFCFELKVSYEAMTSLKPKTQNPHYYSGAVWSTRQHHTFDGLNIIMACFFPVGRNPHQRQYVQRLEAATKDRNISPPSVTITDSLP
ncbi:uncharacterized protein LOC141599316 isoform X1 [Silene latifolia]|uniref:uncharacterized protein LOC141599316 isoform X1 n=1 Tax=Silene latifolia TaxID=37657 RepID=UPI003D776A29